MDPLSGIVQTAMGIGQALQFLRSLGEIPNEFKALLEELSTLQHVIRHVEDALTEFKSTDSLVPGPGSPLEGIDTSIISSLKNDLIQVNSHLGALCDRLRKSRSQNAESDDTNHIKERVSKYKWQKEKGNIDKLQEKARTTREHLTLCLSVFNSSQAVRQAKLMHEMKQSLLDSTQAFLQLHEQQKQQFLLQFNVLLDRQHQGPGDKNQASETDPVSIVAAKATDEMPDLGDAVGSLSSQVVQIPGPLVRRCHFSCVCICHQPQRFESPGILSAWLGRLAIHSRAFSALPTTECDYKGCKSKSETSLRLIYTFPRWMLARSVEVAISWSALTGAGSSLHLRIPRVLETHAVWRAIELGDLEWIQRSLTAKSLYPTDTSMRGHTLVSRALQFHQIHIAGFLALVGSDVHGMDEFGENAVLLASKLLADFEHYFSQHTATHERLILERIASPWGDHNSADGNIDGGAESILARCTSTNAHLNRLDQFGRAPLHVAAERANVDTLKALLTAGAELNITDIIGQTPLFYAVQQGSVKCVELLLEAGADANFTDVYSNSPITFAFPSPNILSLLVNYGANICNPSNHPQGCTDPLDYATHFFRGWTHHDETIAMWAQSLDLLISAGLDIYSRTRDYQQTYLLAALLNRNAPLVDLLIDRGAQVTAVDSRLNTIFHYAASSPQVECVQVLRQAEISNVDPDAINLAGNTPMDEINWQKSKPNLGPGESRITQPMIQLFSKMIQEARQRFAASSREGGSDIGSDAGEVGSENSLAGNPCGTASNPALSEIVTTGQAQKEGSLEDQDDETDREEFFDARS